MTDQSHGVEPSAGPRQTFLNLAEGKRDRLVELAIEEFAQHPYAEASLSRIVARAGIAKGSIYQYFDNKLELYRWLVTDELPRRKSAALVVHSPPRGAALEDLLRALVLSGIRFLLDNPRLALLAMQAAQPSREPELEAIRRVLEREGQRNFIAILERARDQGQLRCDVPVPLVARVLGSVLGHGLRTLVLDALDIDLYEIIERSATGSSIVTLPQAELEGLVDDTVRVLVEGLRP